MGANVSAGMIERVVQRQCSNTALVANVNAPGQLPALVLLNNNNNSDKLLLDDCICTGAMELFAQPFAVLTDMAVCTKPNGELWVSFQLQQQEQDKYDVHDDKSNPHRSLGKL